MSVLSEFKSFTMRGNVVDMAVGIIIGAAFGKIVSSFVSDVVMPPIGVMLGGVDFADLMIIIQQETAGQPAVAINYGAFLQTIIDFLIIALAVFAGIRAMNAMKRREQAKPTGPTPPPPDIALLTEIRDLLKKESLN